MASKKDAKVGAWKGFFNFYLEDGQKAAIKKLSMAGPATVSRMVELADAGYKVSVAYSVDQSAYFATATGSKGQIENRGWSLTQAHSDFAVALACLWFIVFEIYNGSAWPVEASSSDDYDW